MAALFAMTTACESGGDDPDAENGGDSGSSGSGNNAGSPGGGSGSAMAGSSSSGSSTGGSGGGSSGGSGGKSPSGPSICDTGFRVLPLEETFVDNFEDALRFTGWYSFSDTTPANEPKIMREAGGALETAMGAHVAATGIKAPTAMGYGAGFGFNLVNTDGGETCLDVSAFKGISFWAKGTAGADNTLKFQAVVPATQPAAGDPPKGDCTVTANCFLHPGKTITITEEWAQYTITFSELASAATTWDGKMILGFNLITPGPAYDAWIDEVAFFVDTAPTGPVMPAEGAGGAPM